VTIVDTSILVEVERGDPLALQTVADLLATGRLAVAAVTVHELLRSPGLPSTWLRFWSEFLEAVTVLDLDQAAAEAAAALWGALEGRGVRPDVGDVLIAGTGLASGAEVLTGDAGFAERLGATLLRPS
jgi:predicted nucleic acid-binding protein